MTTTLRVGEPREILSLVPFRLGFQPRDSVVALCLRPPRGRVGMVMRLDLADLADARSGPQIGRAMVSTLAADGAERAVLVVYVDADPRGADGPAHSAVRHFREAADVPFGRVEVWVVTDTGYLALDCTDGCCPPGGRPLRDLEGTLVSAHMVLQGQVVAPSRADLVRFPVVDAERRKTVGRVRRRWQQQGLEAHRRGVPELESWRLASLAAWRTAVRRVGRAAGASAGADARGHGHPPWGRLEAGLADVRVRDAVLVALVPGSGDLPERTLRGARLSPQADAEMGRVLARVMTPGVGRVPPEEPTALHERTLEGVVAHGRHGSQAPALTLLAWLAWWRGDGTRARILAERALLDDDDYRLAALLVTALDAATPPGWARRDAPS